jgi:hypothetical protein
MSLSKSKCWYSNNFLHFLKCTVPLKLNKARYNCTKGSCALSQQSARNPKFKALNPPPARRGKEKIKKHLKIWKGFHELTLPVS